MENIMVWHAVGQILGLLGYTQKKAGLENTIHYFTQLPIYPEVIHALELQWHEIDYCPRSG